MDELTRELRYVPVTTAPWRAAARLWAERRKAGRATASEAGLDGDVLIAAQAIAEEGVVVTPNVKHFELVRAVVWANSKFSFARAQRSVWKCKANEQNEGA